MRGLAAVSLGIGGFFSIFDVVKIKGDSMSPTLKDGQVIIAKKKFTSPKENEIVLFRTASDRLLIKRIAKIHPNGHSIWVSSDNTSPQSLPIDSRTLGWIPVEKIFGLKVF